MSTSIDLPPYMIVGDPPPHHDPGTGPLTIEVIIRTMDVGRMAEALVNQYAADHDEVLLVFHPASNVTDGARLVLGRAKYVRSDSGRAPLRQPLETLDTADGVITVESAWEA